MNDFGLKIGTGDSPVCGQRCFALAAQGDSWKIPDPGWIAILIALLLPTVGAAAETAGPEARPAGVKSLRVALVQFDATPEQSEHNLQQMDRLTRQAVSQKARLVMFHEGALTDYTARLKELAEPVPGGNACQRMGKLAKELDCFISFGLSERDGDRYYITQVFVGPQGLVHRYRKTWIFHNQSDAGFRNEHARYDPGTGPELFTIDGIAATCFICSDGEAPRCIDRAITLRPQLIFYPNNRAALPPPAVFGDRARRIGAAMLVTNRVGKSWHHDCQGGCVAFDAAGDVLTKANREGREEILVVGIPIPARAPDSGEK
jgi:predicted amidohydrolase